MIRAKLYTDASRMKKRHCAYGALVVFPNGFHSEYSGVLAMPTLSSTQAERQAVYKGVGHALEFAGVVGVQLAHLAIHTDADDAVRWALGGNNHSTGVALRTQLLELLGDLPWSIEKVFDYGGGPPETNEWRIHRCHVAARKVLANLLGRKAAAS